MENRSNAIKEYIAQFVLIVFSVVLGLYLSERIEERKEIQESYDLLTTIKTEVKDNISLLEYWSPHHKEIKEKLDSLSKDEVFIEQFVGDKFFFFEKLFTRGTFMSRMLASDAWDIAKSHPLVVKIDYDKYLTLSRVYNQQKITFEPGFEMIELLKSKDVNIEKDAKSNLALICDRLHELVAREKQLMDFYKEAEEKLDLKDDRDVDK